MIDKINSLDKTVSRLHMVKLPDICYLIFTLYPICLQCSSLTAREGLVDASGGALVITGGIPVRPQQAI